MAPRPEDLVPELVDGEPKDAKVSIPSSWRSCQPDSTSLGVNTVDLPVCEAQTQTQERLAVGVQTDEGTAKISSKVAKKAEAHLPGFLSRVEGLMSEEFVRVAEEHEALEPLVQVGDQAQEPATVLHTLTPFTSQASGYPSSSEDRVPMSLGGAPTPAGPSGPYAKLVVTCLSWSSTGQTIAASYGRYDVAGWCTDRGALVTWNVGREVVMAHKPDTTIDVDVCLMHCAFHPEHPALVAGGTFNGDVYVWDLSQETDMQRGRSDSLCDIRHQEPICGIAWQYSMTQANKYGNRSQAYRLVTLGADGRVLVWTWHKMDAPVYAYQLLWPAPGSDRKILWGGTSLSFMTNQMGTGGRGEGGGGGAGANSSHFVVGTEGGRIFKCYYDVSSTTAKEFHKALLAGEKVEVRCPIKEASYAPHAGAVYGVHCCPHQRDLFLSAGADGGVRLYHSLRGSPLLTVEPAPGQLMGVQWSATRPLVFAAAGAEGNVYIYDLLQTQQLVRPVLVLEAAPVPGHPAHSMAFNAKRPELFATGAQNCIMIWRLPPNLSTVRKGEIALLRKVAASDDVAEALQGGNR